ncbi:MAG: hypothetical protein ACYCSG_01070 [Thermoplasmataceae archaeon]
MESKISSFHDWLISNSKISMPILAIGFSLLLAFLGLTFENMYYIPYFIPLAVFLAMHYTGFFGIKKRLLYGFIIFIVIWLLAVTMAVPYSYANPGPQTLSTSNGGSITTTITPFYGVHNEFNVSLVITSVPNNQSYMPSIALISDSYSGVSLYKYINLTNISVPSSGIAHINFILSSIPTGVYYMQTNLIGSSHKFNVTSNIVKGPLDVSGETFYGYLLIDYFPLYVLFFEIILSGGMMIARSISHSYSYSNRNLKQ